MKQSIFILVALWGLIGAFVPSEPTNFQNDVNSQNTAIQVQEERAANIVVELK
jgi:hypothetical protein